MEELKEAFSLFDAENQGKIGTKHLVSTMKSLGFDTKSPLVFNMIAELDNEKYENGITFDQFTSEISTKLGDRTTKEGLGRLFKLFDTDNSGSINPQNLKKVVKELGDTMTNDEIKDLIEHASSNGEYITFDDFYQIMTKKAFS